MFTFHAIDTVTGNIYDKECLNNEELSEFMVNAEKKYNTCQVIEDLTGKKVIYTLNEKGQFEVHSKHRGWE